MKVLVFFEFYLFDWFFRFRIGMSCLTGPTTYSNNRLQPPSIFPNHNVYLFSRMNYWIATFFSLEFFCFVLFCFVFHSFPSSSDGGVIRFENQFLLRFTVLQEKSIIKQKDQRKNQKKKRSFTCCLFTFLLCPVFKILFHRVFDKPKKKKNQVWCFFIIIFFSLLALTYFSDCSFCCVWFDLIWFDLIFVDAPSCPHTFFSCSPSLVECKTNKKNNNIFLKGKRGTRKYIVWN